MGVNGGVNAGEGDSERYEALENLVHEHGCCGRIRTRRRDRYTRIMHDESERGILNGQGDQAEKHMSNGNRMVRMPTYEMYLSGTPHRDGTLGLSFAKPRSSSWRASGALRIQLSRRAGGDWCCSMGVRREPRLF